MVPRDTVDNGLSPTILQKHLFFTLLCCNVNLCAEEDQGQTVTDPTSAVTFVAYMAHIGLSLKYI